MYISISHGPSQRCCVWWPRLSRPPTFLPLLQPLIILFLLFLLLISSPSSSSLSLNHPYRISTWTTGTRISTITSSSSSSASHRHHHRIGFIATTPTTTTTATTPSISYIRSFTLPRQQRRTMSLSTSTTTSSDHHATTFTPNHSRRVIVHWFRDNDLRLHDNPALIHSTSLLATTLSSSTTII